MKSTLFLVLRPAPYRLMVTLWAASFSQMDPMPMQYLGAGILFKHDADPNSPEPLCFPVINTKRFATLSSGLAMVPTCAILSKPLLKV